MLPPFIQNRTAFEFFVFPFYPNVCSLRASFSYLFRFLPVIVEVFLRLLFLIIEQSIHKIFYEIGLLHESQKKLLESGNFIHFLQKFFLVMYNKNNYLPFLVHVCSTFNLD